MTIILFVVVLAVLILSHEFGHFIVAKKSGVRVDEFGLGFPPRLWGWRRGETTYTLNLLPLGGFVKIFGENPDEESLAGPDAARSLTSKPKSIQAAVLVAGVVCNLLLAWLFLSIGLMSGLPVSTSSGLPGISGERLVITSVSPGSPAAVALKAGDQIVALTAGAKQLSTLTPEGVQSFIAGNGGRELTLTYRRASEPDQQVAQLKPVTTILPDRPAIGITMDLVGTAKLGFFPALWVGLKLTAQLAWATASGLWHLISGAFAGQSVLKTITGPVGLAGLVSDAAGLGWAYLLSFTAFISINLAVLNLVPFPALDGGRLLFLLIEKLKGSAISPRVANALNLAGFALLLLLMAVVTYGDIARLLS